MAVDFRAAGRAEYTSDFDLELAIRECTARYNDGEAHTSDIK